MPSNIKQQKKLIRLISAFSDITNSLNAADLLVAGVSEDLYEHFFVSMVIAYGRPFCESHGVGRIQCDYPNYPDFGDAEMPVRHTRLLDLRNKFIAHSSAEGILVRIIPNRVGLTTTFDFGIGKRIFPDVRFVEWLRVAPANFRDKLHSDIRQLLLELYGGDTSLQIPFGLPTGYEKFHWT